MFFRFIIGFVVLTTWGLLTDSQSAGTFLAKVHKAYMAEMLK